MGFSDNMYTAGFEVLTAMEDFYLLGYNTIQSDESLC
jgi:hypothetical protein